MGRIFIEVLVDSINFSVEHSRPLLSLAKTLSLTFSASFSIPELSRFGFELQKLINSVTQASPLLDNCKGKNDELFFFSGAIPLDESDLRSKDGISFEYSILTVFEKISSPGKLQEKVSESLIGDLPEGIEAKNLTWLAPVFPKELRVGMEFYTPHFFSSSLGLAPVLREYFEIKASPSSVSMSMSNQKFTDQEKSPISNVRIWEGICEAFQKSTNISLHDLYLSKI